ncbi:MAG: MFS transporter [Alloprevotella sp.]|nr:MFS transporter [Alloprevotella sp.]
MQTSKKSINPWAWIPTLYFAEGIPYVVVMAIAVVMYKRLGLSNTDIALYTSWLYLPWVIKPFWSPIVDMLRTKRWWILVMQLLVGASMAGVAFTIPTQGFVQWTLCFFWLMAFSSATHDIAADGFYMLALNEHEQSLFVGIRSTFYRVATIAGQGLLTVLAGTLEVYTRNPSRAWAYTFFVAATVFILLWLYHSFFLPSPHRDADRPAITPANVITPFITFFKKREVVVAIAFMLLYRLPEALLTKICPLFLLDKPEAGGIGLTTSELGFVQGTVGVIGLTIGGILGGIVVARHGFNRWLWPMVCAITIPDALYIVLAYFQPDNMLLLNVCIFTEQFGYGFGFTAYMLYMLYFAQGDNETAHYAFCTGFMALSMMLPGMVAGWLQESVGYLNFFIIVMCLTPLTFLAAWMVKVDEGFGKKAQ